MGKIDSMWFFQKLSLGLAIVNGIALALVDKKVTVDEIINLINTLLMGVADDLKITLADLQITTNSDGSVSITLSKELVDKLNFKV